MSCRCVPAGVSLSCPVDWLHRCCVKRAALAFREALAHGGAFRLRNGGHTRPGRLGDILSVHRAPDEQHGGAGKGSNKEDDNSPPDAVLPVLDRVDLGNQALDRVLLTLSRGAPPR